MKFSLAVQSIFFQTFLTSLEIHLLPLDKSKAEAYRLGVHKVVLTDDGVGVEYMKYHGATGTDDSDDTLQDGKTVRSVYRLIRDLSCILHLNYNHVSHGQSWHYLCRLG